MYQLTVSVASLDQLYTLSGHLAELDFLSESAAEQAASVAQAPQGTEDMTPAPNSTSDENSEELLATDRQINYLNDLALKAGWKLHVFEEAITALFNLDDFSQLTKQMASDLITRLQDNSFQS